MVAQLDRAHSTITMASRAAHVLIDAMLLYPVLR
jgi:hypothetical protein